MNANTITRKELAVALSSLSGDTVSVGSGRMMLLQKYVEQRIDCAVRTSDGCFVVLYYEDGHMYFEPTSNADRLLQLQRVGRLLDFRNKRAEVKEIKNPSLIKDALLMPPLSPYTIKIGRIAHYLNGLND